MCGHVGSNPQPAVLHIPPKYYTQFWNEYLGPQTKSNEHVFNYKFVDIIEHYNFDFGFVSPSDAIWKFWI